MARAGSPHHLGPDGVRSAGSLPHGWALSAPPWGQRLAIWGPPAWHPQRSPSTPASCRFSCEELQGIDLELNVDNSAFYDQFVIAQVGGAARVGGAA